MLPIFIGEKGLSLEPNLHSTQKPLVRRKSMQSLKNVATSTEAT
jgi:hypothetical protein